MAINPKAPGDRSAAIPSADAGCGVGALGNLIAMVFLVTTLGMAAVALHQESRLAHHERQLLDQ